MRTTAASDKFVPRELPFEIAGQIRQTLENIKTYLPHASLSAVTDLESGLTVKTETAAATRNGAAG